MQVEKQRVDVEVRIRRDAVDLLVAQPVLDRAAVRIRSGSQGSFRRPSVQDYQNASNNGNGNTNGKVNGHANGVTKPNGLSVVDTRRAGCFSDMDQTLRAAVEIAQGAEAHATALNYSLRFTSEDVRAIGLSLFIQMGREGGTR